ncbi:hypothetical protein HMPREF9630_00419 [Peptoanaerobacter stomatis]|uniref:Flagellar hook-length control protein-like C-terminal domain-containing protein n=1 Tax=Peptoanaerobacter stomatis TaxID=796937 RepID=V9HUC9_9FIRM|nr:flagellar hook-length control protein FliK [Peptoanaerobacter stomatis]EHL17252.1 hypothetical protein HMPREF9630_00419 [Peptoanaerobacter stomatis]
MRIDIDSIGYRPEFMPQKPSGEVNELNNRGENVRGRIIDVNQNIVLIQTSTGKQFSATTTVPMENFVGQEMSFALMIGLDGELLLKPEIDEKNQKTLVDLKIEDMLNKLGKQITPDNKELIKQMMKASMPINKEQFEEIKELNFAMNLLKSDEFAVNLENGDNEKNLNELLKELQTRKDFGLTNKSETAVLNKETDLKDILLLKNLGLKVNVNNLKSLYDVLNKANVKQDDIIGMNNLINDKEFSRNLRSELENITNIQVEQKDENNFVKTTNVLLENAEKLSFKEMENLNKAFKNIEFKDFSENILTDTIKESVKNPKLQKEIKSDEITEMLKNIEKGLIKKIQQNGKYNKSDLQVEYEKAKEEIKDIISIFSSQSDTAKAIEKQVLPKLDLLMNMAEKYNYNVIPFKVGENYENVLQYYMKKGKKSLKKQDEINVGLSIDTMNYGNVKAMVNYDKKDSLKLDFYTQDKNVKNLFDNNISKLKDILKTIGFSNININVRVNENKSHKLINDVLFDDKNLKSFEMWI